MITLDEEMQAVGGPGEDTSGGFKYGGCSAPYSEHDAGSLYITESLSTPSGVIIAHYKRTGKSRQVLWGLNTNRILSYQFK